MNIIKRGIWNITKNFKKSILTLLIMTVIMILIITSLAIRNSAKVATSKAELETSSEVILTNDMNKLINSSSDNPTLIDDKLISKIEKSEYVKDTNYTINAYVFAKYKTTMYYGNTETIMGGDGSESDFNPPTNMVYPLDNPSDNVDFNSKKMSLIDGVFPKESEAKNPIIVSKDYLAINKFKIGQEINVLGGPSSTTPMKLTIVGVFEVLENKNSSDMEKLYDQEKKDSFFTDLETAKKIFATNPDGTKEDVTYQTVKITLNSGKDLEKFIEEYESYNMDREFINLTSDKEAVDNLLSSINSIGEIANVTVVICIASSIVIIGLITMLNLRSRRYELGILLSLGAKKVQIILQMILESIIVMSVAIGLSLCVSQLISNNAQEYIMDEVKIESEEKETSSNVDNGGFIMMPQEDNDIASDITIPNITINILNKDIIILGISIGLGVALLATVIPALLIVRNDPRTLLLRRD